MLSKENIDKLSSKGLKISNGTNRISIIKPKGLFGNSLPENNQSKIIIHFGEEEMFSDCPIMRVNKTDNKFTASCWDWAPGPGPGDFAKDFVTEDELVSFSFDLTSSEFKSLRWVHSQEFELDKDASLFIEEYLNFLDKNFFKSKREFLLHDINLG